MTDAETLAAILDAHEPDSHAEFLALIGAHAMLRGGADPAEVLAHLEAQSDSIRAMAALEHQHGVAAVFELAAQKARELREREQAELADSNRAAPPA